METENGICKLCISERHKFFRWPMIEEDVLDFLQFDGKIIAMYKRGHVETLSQVDEHIRQKAEDELKVFQNWLIAEHRSETLTQETIAEFRHLHWIFA